MSRGGVAGSQSTCVYILGRSDSLQIGVCHSAAPPATVGARLCPEEWGCSGTKIDRSSALMELTFQCEQPADNLHVQITKIIANCDTMP